MGQGANSPLISTLIVPGARSQSLTSVHHGDCLGAKAPVIAVSTAIHASCECDEAQIHFSFQRQSILTVAIELPSSATLPSWEKWPSWANSPSSAKSLSSANSPLGKVVTSVITSIPLALMQLLCCPHRRRRPGGLVAHPFTGVNARLLVLGLFGVFPARSAPIRACAPLSSNVLSLKQR